jgi:hypothetical protein
MAHGLSVLSWHLSRLPEPLRPLAGLIGPGKPLMPHESEHHTAVVKGPFLSAGLQRRSALKLRARGQACLMTLHSPFQCRPVYSLAHRPLPILPSVISRL